MTQHVCHRQLLFVLARALKIIVWSYLWRSAKSCPWAVGGAQVIDCLAWANPWFPSSTPPEVSSTSHSVLHVLLTPGRPGARKAYYILLCVHWPCIGQDTGILSGSSHPIPALEVVANPLGSPSPVKEAWNLVGLGSSDLFCGSKTFLWGFPFLPFSMAQHAHSLSVGRFWTQLTSVARTEDIEV